MARRRRQPPFAPAEPARRDITLAKRLMAPRFLLPAGAMVRLVPDERR